MKKIVTFIIFMALVASCWAQEGDYSNVRGIRLRGGDRVRIGTGNGNIYYDLDSSKFFFRQNNAWLQLGSGEGVGVTDGDKGDISVVTGSWLIDNGVVTFPKFQNVSTSTLLGRITASTGVVESLTPAQVNTMLPIFTRTLKGLTPPSGGVSGTANFLREDGVWSVPPGTGGAGSGTTETASNGLNKVGVDIRLGGTTDLDTDVVVGFNQRLRFGSTGTGAGSYNLYYETDALGNTPGWILGSGDFLGATTQHNYIQTRGDQVYIRSASASHVNGVSFWISNVAGTIFDDNRAVPEGIRYNSSGYVSHPQSLADKQYVDQAVAAVSQGGVPTGDKGDINVTNQGATWTIDPDAVTYSKMQNVTGLRFLGRQSSTSGNVEEITGAWATSMLTHFTTSNRGVVPVSPGGTTVFLRADGAWATPPGTATTPGVFTSTVNGLAPASGGGTTKYLRSDATWAVFPTAFTSATSGLVPASGGGTGKYLDADGVWKSLPILQTGTYTPTAVIVQGFSSVTPGGSVKWVRVNDMVTVTGTFSATPNTANETIGRFRLTLPIASNIVSGDLMGQGSGHQLRSVWTIYGDDATNTALLQMFINSTGQAHSCDYTYTYQIK